MSAPSSGLTEQNRITRATGVGASEVGALFGVHNFVTLLDLFEHKCRVQDNPDADEFDINEAATWGLILEPVIADHYATKTGIQIEKRGETIRHPNHKRVVCTPDYLGIDSDDKLINVQIKTANAFKRNDWGDPWTHNVPMMYYLQVQQEMEITGLDVTHIPVLFGGQEFAVYEVERDRVAGQKVIKAINNFWPYIETGECPPLSSVEDLARIRADRGNVVVANQTIQNLVFDLASIKNEIKELERKKTECGDTIKRFMSSGTELISPTDAKLLATWYSAEALGVKKETLQREAPELFERLAETTVSRRFNIKIK